MKPINSNLVSRVTAIIFIAFLCGPVKAMPENRAPSREYDFRNAALGMTLTQFRTGAFPDADRDKKAKVFCSSDKVSNASGIWFDLDSESAVGVIECKWFTPDYFHSWREADLSLGATGIAKWARYKFVPDPHDRIVRLYSIVVAGYPRDAVNVMDGLRGKFGSPTRIARDVVQNAMGAKFDHTVATWVNPLSTILFESPWDDIDTMGIFYYESRLSAYVEHSKQKAKGSNASKM